MNDEWIGVKSETYNVEDNGVKLELWVDDREEENNWEKVADYNIPTRASRAQRSGLTIQSLSSRTCQ